MALLPDLSDFLHDHRPHGPLTADATEPAWKGYLLSRWRVRVDQPESTILVPRETSQSSTNLQLDGSSRFQRSMALAGIATTGQLRRSTVSTSFLRSVGLVWSFLSSSSSIVILIVSFARWTNAMGRRRGTADYQETDGMTGLVVVGRRRGSEESRARPWMERCHLRQRLGPDGSAPEGGRIVARLDAARGQRRLDRTRGLVLAGTIGVNGVLDRRVLELEAESAGHRRIGEVEGQVGDQHD